MEFIPMNKIRMNNTWCFIENSANRFTFCFNLKLSRCELNQLRWLLVYLGSSYQQTGGKIYEFLWIFWNLQQSLNISWNLFGHIKSRSLICSPYRHLLGSGRTEQYAYAVHIMHIPLNHSLFAVSCSERGIFWHERDLGIRLGFTSWDLRTCDLLSQKWTGTVFQRLTEIWDWDLRLKVEAEKQGWDLRSRSEANLWACHCHSLLEFN